MLKVVTEKTPESDFIVALLDSDGDLWVRDEAGHVVVFTPERINVNFTEDDFLEQLEGNCRAVYYSGDDIKIRFA